MPKKELSYQFVRGLKPPEKPISYYDQVEKGLILRLSKVGTKTFEYRYKTKGKLKRFKIGRFPGISLSEARKRVRKLRNKVDEGYDPQAEKKKRKKQSNPKTFEELVHEFKEKYLPTLRESTRKEYQRIIDVELLPKLGEYNADDIDKNQVVKLLNKKAYDGDAPTMANKIRARLSRIYTFGMEQGLAENNPVRLTSTYKNGRTKRERFYNEDEIRNLWDWFEQFQHPTQDVFKMLLISGQRKTETMKMQWDNIRGDVWTIPASLAKNKTTHDVPLSDMALQVIEQMRSLNGKTDYVFCSPKKQNAPLAWLTRARVTIQKHSEVSDFRPHDLRRTVATHMAKLGIERTVLGKILNHKSSSGDTLVTAIYDRHSYMKEKRQALNRWNDYLQNILNHNNELQTNLTPKES